MNQTATGGRAVRRGLAYYMDYTHDFYVSSENRTRWMNQISYIAFIGLHKNKNDIPFEHFIAFRSMREQLFKQKWKIIMARVLKCIKVSQKIVPFQRKIKEWYYSPENTYARMTISSCVSTYNK